MNPPDFLQLLDHGITVIDTGFHRPQFDAAYLMVQDGRAAFIDTAHNDAVPRLLAALQFHGLGVEAVDWVIPTHVHLDHAGGTGLLMQHLPHARALIHPRGARHLIDPTALIAGATAVYGAEEVARTYGELVPIPAERVVESHDEMTVHLADRPLRLIDTPGHARHHHCVWDAASRGWFTGDTFGISYRELDGPLGEDSPYIMPSSTPVQFDPAAMRASITRMLQADPQWIYPTHFGRLGQVPAQSHPCLVREFQSGPYSHPLLRLHRVKLHPVRHTYESEDRQVQDILLCPCQSYTYQGHFRPLGLSPESPAPI